jgi:hypothetical protein
MEKTDNKKMEEGISQILEFTPYKNYEPEPECEHLSDGHEYGRKGKKLILKCEICGLHYEEIME